METKTFGQRAKSIFKRVVIIGIVIALGLLAFLYWATFERGVMAGKVLRISEKGLIFKTYEVKLSLESFGALKGVSPVAETFDFSVESSEDETIKLLNEVALSGERVNLHFKKQFIAVPWRGDTKYFVTQVERSK